MRERMRKVTCLFGDQIPGVSSSLEPRLTRTCIKGGQEETHQRINEDEGFHVTRWLRTRRVPKKPSNQRKGEKDLMKF